jgi:hypothetical protein
VISEISSRCSRAALRAALSSGLTLAADHATAQPAQPEGREVELAVTPPKLLTSPEVPYPEGATGDARVVLVVVVDSSGAAVEVTAPADAPEPFASRAIEAAKSFRFEPARRGERAIAAKIRLELSFSEPELVQTPAPDDAAVNGVPRANVGVPEQREVEIIVEGQRPEPSRSASLSRAEVRQLPGAFGDPFRAIEALPGVTPIVSGLPFFFIRGAPPGNAGYFLDGVRVPLLFHVGVGPSVVHPALIERVDLYPGGYPARFGRFSGGVVAGETAPPAVETHGEYNLRVFDAGALIETPLAGGRGALLVGARYSYTALLFSLLSPNARLDYWDYQLRGGYAFSERDRLEVFSFGSYDFLGQTTATRDLTLFETEFHRVDLRYDRTLARGRLRTAFTIGRDTSTAQQNRDVHSLIASSRHELEYRASRSVLVRAGSDLTIERYQVDTGTPDFSPSAARIAELFATRSDVAMGARGDVVLALGQRLTLTPGLRIDLFGSRGVTAWGIDPRLALRTQVSERFALLGAFGIAHQPPSFVVPVPGVQPAGLDDGLQRAMQESFGIEADLGDGMVLTTTLFQNGFFDMSDPLGTFDPALNDCPPGFFASDTLPGDPGGQPDEPVPCGPRFIPGTLGPDRAGGAGQGADGPAGQRAVDAFTVRTLGRAYGLEVLLKRRLTRRLGGFLSYTLSRSTRSYQGRSYVATFDRTHVLNLAAAYDLGKGFRAGARTVYYTGLPRQMRTGIDGRLPAFFRLDLRGEKRWRLGEKAFISAVAEWMNVTLNKEAVATRCTLQGCEAELIGPVTIPSLGLEGGF